VKGSAYRREGTQMFVRRDQTYECALSGGCLEPAVAAAAARVIASGDATVISYDLADDSVWGLGIGCTGAVAIHIERIARDPVTAEWLRILDRGESAVQVTALSRVSGRLVVRANDVLGSLSDPAVERQAVTRARDDLRTGEPRSRVESIAGADLFFLVTMPAP